MATGRNLTQRISQLSKVNGVPRELQQVQRNVERATDDARRNEMNRGKEIEVELDPANPLATINHKLGRKPTGFMVVSKLGPGDADFRDQTVRDDGGTSDDPTHTSRHLRLNVSGTTPAKFKVRVW